MSENVEWTEAEIVEMLPLYRLGALEPDEVVMMDKHLAANPQWLEKLADTDHALVALAESVPYAALPANAKERLLAAIQPEATAAARSVAQTKPAAPPTNSFGAWLVSLWQGRGLWQFAAAASFAVVLFLAIYTANLSTQLDISEAQVATLTTDNEQLAGQVATLNEEREELAAANENLITQIQLLQQDFNTNNELLASAQSDPSLLLDVVNANNTIVLHNHTEGELPRGVFYQSGHSGRLVVHGLDPLPAAQTYQFWAVTRDGSQIPTALVDVTDRDAATWTSVTIPDTVDITDVVAIGISIEPASGSPIPTTPMLLDGEL